MGSGQVERPDLATDLRWDGRVCLYAWLSDRLVGLRYSHQTVDRQVEAQVRAAFTTTCLAAFPPRLPFSLGYAFPSTPRAPPGAPPPPGLVLGVRGARATAGSVGTARQGAAGPLALPVYASASVTLLPRDPVYTSVQWIPLRPPIPHAATTVFLPRAPISAPAVALPFRAPVFA